MFRCADDNTFGPVLGTDVECGRSFDFTLLFEEAVFCVVPCCLLLSASPFLVAQLWHAQRCAGTTAARIAKLAVYFLCCICQLVLVVLWSAGFGERTRVTLAAGTLDLVSFATVTFISDRVHCCCLKPSATVEVFLLVTAILYAARARTQWLLPHNSPACAIFTAALGLRVLVLVLESLPKKIRAGPHSTPAVPEFRGGIFNRSLFLWVNHLLRFGYSNTLSLENLYPLDTALTSSTLYAKVDNLWAKCDKSSKYCLAWTLVKGFSCELLSLSVPRLALIGFTITQPFLVEKTLNYIASDATEPEEYGYGLLGAYALVYTGLAISNGLYRLYTYRLVTMIRGALVSLIYRGMLVSKANGVSSSVGVNLMSNDVDIVTIRVVWFVSFIPCCMEVGLALWILWAHIGAVFVAPIITALACAILTSYTAQLTPSRQRSWMESIQKRVGVTTEVLKSIRGLKMTGKNNTVGRQLQELRDFELDESRRLRVVQVPSIVLVQTPSILIPAITFTVYAIAQQISGSSQFGTTKAFTSLSLLGVLVGPVTQLIQMPTTFASAMDCLGRIQQFLVQETHYGMRAVSTTGIEIDHENDPPSGDSDSWQAEVKPWFNISRATFGWSVDSSTLHDISFNILPSTLLMVIGPVGCGKTTLLCSLLGETHIQKGSVSLDMTESIAYCGQDPWMLNASIKENIVGPFKFDQPLYNAVINACQLREDITYMVNGDKTIIGSQGCSLSGGQKQRLGMARVAYSNERVSILDDSFKGLDAATSDLCFRLLLGPQGLLRQGKRAVVLATHDAQLLPFADQVMVLSKTGHIDAMGTFEELREANGYVQSLHVVQKSMIDESDAENLVETRFTSAAIKSKNADQNASASTTARTPSMTRKGSLLFYIKSMGLCQLVIFALLLILQIGCRSMQPLWLNFWTTSAQHNPGQDIGKWVGVYFLFGIMTLTLMSSEIWYFLMHVVPASAKALHRVLVAVALRAPMGFYVDTDIGDIINRFSQDLTLVDLPLPVAFMVALERSTEVIAQLALTSVSSGYLALVIPLIVVVLFVIQRVYLATSRQMRVLDLEGKSPLYSHFISSAIGLVTVRAFGWSQYLHEQNLARLDVSQKPVYLLYCLQCWLTLVLELLVAGLASLLVGLALALRGRIDPGLLGVALSSVVGFGQTLTALLTAWTQLETNLGAVTRIRDFEKLTPREPDTCILQMQETWPSQGRIEFVGIKAAYGSCLVLRNIDLIIHEGAKVAICGRSGSGKSTLLSLILRLYNPSAGKIRIDGVDISSLALQQLRQSLVTLPQEPLLLPGTVRNNLNPSEELSEHELWTALEKVGLGPLLRDKGGLSVDLDLAWFSAGQKQLFSIARALLQPGRILLLDEATSSLDEHTEKAMMDVIRGEFRSWTVVAIVHHLRTVADFDKIAVLEKGVIAEFGNPAVLLERGGIFKNMWVYRSLKIEKAVTEEIARY